MWTKFYFFRKIELNGRYILINMRKVYISVLDETIAMVVVFVAIYDFYIDVIEREFRLKPRMHSYVYARSIWSYPL